MSSDTPITDYLNDLSNRLILPDNEKTKIDASVKNIRDKLIVLFFDEGLIDIRPFGSYDRGTLLSRKIDSESDVDLLIMFEEKKWESQTYLNKFKKFAEDNYSRSDIFQDHPTIVVGLTNIKFELTPCIYRPETGMRYEKYFVPKRGKEEIEWVETNPFETKNKINEFKNTKSLLISLILIFKYWNLKNGSVYKTFEVENFVIKNFNHREEIYENFCQIIENLSNKNPENSQNELNKKTKEIKNNIRLFVDRGVKEYGLMELKKIIPELA